MRRHLHKVHVRAGGGKSGLGTGLGGASGPRRAVQRPPTFYVPHRLCVQALKWEGFLSLLQTGESVGVHRSIYMCVRPKWKGGMDLYEAMKACQYEDCRVQMWGCKAVKVDQDPRGYDTGWNKYSVADTGKYGIDLQQAMFGPDPKKSFKAVGKMPDFSQRLLRFWEWPYTINGEVYGARGLMDEGLFPYPVYRMLGGQAFQTVEVQ